MQELMMGPVAIWFGVPALVGTAFFTLRLIATLVGGADGDAGIDMDVDVADADAVGESGGDVDDSSEAFKILSVQTIATFLMGFGWGGLGAFRGGGWPLPISFAFALACGVGMVWLLGKLLRFVYGLQSSGTVPLYQALESEGTVYTLIPAANAGAGQVRVVIGDRERYYNAVTDGRALERDTRIRVVEINDADNRVKVVEA